MSARPAERRLPALAASAALHGAVVLAAWLALRHAAPPLQLAPEPVAVTVVSSAPPGLPTPAVAAPEPAPAQAPEPTPDVTEPPAEVERPAPAAPSPPPPPVPVPAPRPTPPRPTPRPTPPPPKPAPAPKPAPTPKPAPAPRPAPKPVPRPAPAPKPPPPKPAPPEAKPEAKPRPKDLDLSALASSLPKSKAKAARDLDLSALASSLPNAKASAKAGRGDLDLASLAASLPAGSRRATGARGAPRPETAREARATAGATAASMTGDERAALAAKLIRLWHVNCGVDGANTVVARVRIRLGPDGRLTGAPELLDTSGEASTAVKGVAGQRALSAVRAGEPYTEISPAHLKTMNDFIFKFDAHQACK